MIRTCLLAVAALALASCNKDRPVEGNQAFSDNDFTAQTIVANDVTAIDAATGDAANMAADVPPDTSLDNADEGNGAASEPNRSEPRTRRPAASRRDSASDSAPTKPAADTPTPAAGNTAG